MTPQEAREKLVEALRSGKYKQGTDNLRPTADTYCCLGVACDVIGGGKWDLADEEDSEYTYIVEGVRDPEVLPKPVMERLGWTEPEGRLEFTPRDDDTPYAPSLAGLNDAGFTFDQIADLIEARLVREAETA